MRRIFCALTAAAFAVSIPSTSMAQQLTEQDIQDSECALVMSLALSDAKIDEKAKVGVATMLSYFVGKIRGRDPMFDFSKQWSLSFISDVMKRDPSIRRRCAAEALQMTDDLTVVGDKLVAATK